MSDIKEAANRSGGFRFEKNCQIYIEQILGETCLKISFNLDNFNQENSMPSRLAKTNTL